jgi:hypothetical protein
MYNFFRFLSEVAIVTEHEGDLEADGAQEWVAARGNEFVENAMVSWPRFRHGIANVVRGTHR